MGNLLLTFAVGLAFGYIFLKIKVPGGMMVGAIVGVASLNIFWGMSYMPPSAKIAAQITAGAFIGCTVEKRDLQRLKYLFKPALILLTAMLLLNIILGFVIYFTSPLDLITSLMSGVPGGMSDVPLISADMGADAPKVAILQFARMVAGVGVFPTLISIISRREEKNDTVEPNNPSPTEQVKPSDHNLIVFIQTLVIATAVGIIGKLLNIPAGALLFSIIGVISFKLIFNKAFMPMWAKRVAQVLSGAYIGCGMGYKDVIELKYLLIPAFLLMLGYFITCYIVGKVLSKYYGMSLKEAMLVATPAGASDMALISSDIGVQSTDLIVLQIIRLVVVVTVFPQIVRLIALFVKI